MGCNAGVKVIATPSSVAGTSALTAVQFTPPSK